MVTLGLDRDDSKDESIADRSKVIARIKNSIHIHFLARNIERTSRGTFSISVRKSPHTNESSL